MTPQHDTVEHDTAQHRTPHTDVRESDPNGNGPQGLGGDMSVSSERAGVDSDSGIEGTGSHGTAARATHGVLDTSAPEEADDVPRVHPEDPAEGADPDDDQPDQERVSTEDPAEGADDPAETSGHHVNGDHTSPISGVDRTVGEVLPDPVASKHDFDPDRNARH